MKVTAPLCFSARTRIFISALILIYLLCIIMSAAPPSACTNGFERLLKIHLSYWGIFENYGMYAPNPVRYNQGFYAEITYTDGSQKIWRFPDLADLQGNDLLRQMLEKWTELEYYICWNQQSIRFLPDAARYIARISNRVDSHPVKVTIYRNYYPITVPGVKQDKPLENLHQLLLNYSVTAEDLK